MTILIFRVLKENFATFASLHQQKRPTKLQMIRPAGSYYKTGMTRVGNFWFLYPLVLSKWEDLAFSVSRLFEKSVFILQFFNDKMHNYVKQNITKNFNIKKLNNKHTFLKTEKTKFSRWENLAFSVLRKVCLFFNFWIIKHTNALNKT